MRKFILFITVFTLMLTIGCTQIPKSEETGLGPEGYEGIASTEEIKKENSSLKEELEKIKTEFEELEKNYLRLVKNNENLISKLEETESKLEIISSEDIPEFKSEETDKDSIVSYLNDSSKLIDDSIKGIEIISSGESVVFRTLGYGEEYSQIFIWDEGENEPVLIDGAAIEKGGSYEWLGKYILIKNKDKNKVLDIENKKITGSFDEPQKLQLLEKTASILLKDKDNNFVLYDFINNNSKQINLDNNKYTDFDLRNNIAVFSGAYVENDVEYEIRASITLDKLIEAFDTEGNEEAESEEIEDSV
jgi:hypothetical protein